MIDLDPVWNPGGGRAVVRFGGIRDFDAVRTFFSKIERPEKPDAVLDQINSMAIDSEYVQTPLKRVVIDLEHSGAIEIDCNNVDAS